MAHEPTSKAIGFTFEVEHDASMDEWSARGGQYEHVIERIKVGSCIIWQGPGMIDTTEDRDQQVETRAAEVFMEIFGIRQHWNGSEYEYLTPQHAYSAPRN